MSKDLILGIDTSNYTTSVALVGIDGELVANIKCPLSVKSGERGLRQSDAVFAHVKNIPTVMSKVREYTAEHNIVAVGVSEKPRNIEGSYMPCFLSGLSAAESIASAMNINLYRFSHQCGHIMAALYSSGRSDLLNKEFCAFHVSGGTTEMLRVLPSSVGFDVEILGGTADLNAGQAIDRVGVYMGLPFPSGMHMERLALGNTKRVPKRAPKINDMQMSLSGAENLAKKLYSDTGDASLVSAFVLEYIGRGLVALAEKYTEEKSDAEFVFAGGVMSNSIIKNMISQRFNASFATPELSSDNAVGIACLALNSYKSENK